MQTLRDTTFADVTDAEAVAACYPLLRQLRPHLSGPEELVTRWQSQARAGYRLITLLHGDRPTALAGFRIQENLVHGRHLYVDDLVTDAAARSCGFGGMLLERLVGLARADGCAKLLLDTPLTNVLGHRFYYREGLVAGALRFNRTVADERRIPEAGPPLPG
ncbi:MULTISPECIES: GNAT family N-acetyltransferase [unclassified Methylobacterium]|jgi:ribosomal protein S18 acetylase RimI-like enzyme|uniref:GNAT family N-acetyltransferase n=1 Tax=unclassified Methylobacterium TaxID=2615210 RepID=UPI001352C853|nr:GNAT family N-acetyltransferase [Methylobacterium sp. 2A]MWV23815.1 GNAT family N-acetyltransferase [Methylobacterium sp. 2A]